MGRTQFICHCQRNVNHGISPWEKLKSSDNGEV